MRRTLPAGFAAVVGLAVIAAAPGLATWLPGVLF